MSDGFKPRIGICESHSAPGDTATTDSVSGDVVGILDTIDVPVVVGGADCKVARFNRAAADTLGAVLSDIGRSTCDMQALAGVPAFRRSSLHMIDLRAGSRSDSRLRRASFTCIAAHSKRAARA